MSDPAAKALTYDWTGNLTGGYTPAGYPFSAAYDSDNHLTSLSYTDGAGVVNQTAFTYLGNLLLKKQNYQNGSLVREARYVYDGFQITQERDGNNNLTNEYTYGLGLPGGIGGLLHLNQGGANYAYLYDGKGNVTALLDGVGQVTQTYQYDPFGKPMGASGSINQPMRFSTKPYDEQTGLSYYGYRFYAPALGRWMTREPLGEDAGINLYEFIGNDPINSIDFLGLVKISGVGNEPIYVHPNDVDPFPSQPHGHVGSTDSPCKVDVNTGEIYKGTQKTGKCLSKKQLDKLQNILKNRNLLSSPLMLMFEWQLWQMENPGANPFEPVDPVTGKPLI